MSVKGFYESKVKKNAYGKTPLLAPIGAIVWADTAIFGLFWTVVSVVIIILNDWILFWLTFSIFFVVRSFGETIYWLNQQFSKVNRNPIQKFWVTKIFHDDSVWFVYQIYWQCVTVVSLIASLYFGKLWLGNL